MKGSVVAIIVVAVLVVAAGALYMIQPDRATLSEMKANLAAEKKVEAINAEKAAAEAQTAEAKADPVVTPAVDEAKPAAAESAPAATPAPAETPKKEGEPGVYKVKFECSNGNFVLECHSDWAPLGAERFKKLVQEGFYDNCRFFRVVPGFVVQFGIAADPAIDSKWRDANIKDDPVKQSNKEGMITFAMAGPNTRTTQVFISTGDTSFLDNQGFAPFGKVVEGLDVVKGFNSKYGESITRMQGQIMAQGNAFLDEKYPGLDYVKKATIIE